MKNSNFTKRISIIVAFVTFMGLALHDTRLDTLTKLAIALPAVIATYEGVQMLHLFGDAHTHVERVSLDRAANRSTSKQPALQTRGNEDKKYRLQNGVPKGHHPFDNYTLPMIPA
ncbi:MAG TPA: hypothetical protein VGE34_04240 [Candidatus Saccharimonadales bacterium]